jgi:hypothetical protein
MNVTLFVVMLLALATCAPGNSIRLQSCNPAVVNYLVRDENGKLLSETELKSVYEQLPKSLGDGSTYVGEVSFADDGTSFYWPESVDWKNGRKVPSLHFADAKTCSMHLDEVTLTYRNKRMRLIFNIDITRAQPDRRPVIDSLPFQEGAFVLDLRGWSRDTDKMIPAERWKKVRDETSTQETFHIRNGSGTYDLSVMISKCDEEQQSDNAGICSGPGIISIYRKGSSSPFQILNLKNIEVDKEQTAFNPEINENPRKLYDDEYSFIFGDFNFDAKEDLAVCTGREGGYGAPSYNVYLYNSKLNRFIENKRLSRLTVGYLGLFFVDPKKKQLFALAKSGCCYHATGVYKVINNKPILVEEIIEDSTVEDAAGYDVLITTRKLINGKWVRRVKKEKLDEEKQ